MTCTCAPALITARNELNAVFPSRDKGSDGCCGDAAHAARKSDHNPTNGYAHAFDYDEDVTDNLGDQELQGMALILLADPRTKMLIYEAQALYPDGTVKPYTGVNAHRSHLHHSIKTTATHDTRPWGIARAFQQEEDMPTAEEIADEVLGRLIDLTNGEKQPVWSVLRFIQQDSHNAAALASRIAAGQDPRAFAAEVAKHLDGVTEDDVEQAFRNVLTEGVGGG